jgi:hypothetical protein
MEMIQNFFYPLGFSSISYYTCRNKKNIIGILLGSLQMSDSFIEVELINFTSKEFVFHSTIEGKY